MRVLRRAIIFAVIPVAGALVSCAPRKPAGPVQAAALPAPKPVQKLPPPQAPTPTPPAPTRNTRQPAPEKSPRVAPQSQATPVPAPRPNPPASRPPAIAQFVSNGVPISASPGEEAFRSKSAQPASAPALFEDAIILNRVRSVLKASSPDYAAIAAAAKVSGGVIALTVPPGTGARQTAALVDTALAVEGVRGVRALTP